MLSASYRSLGRPAGGSQDRPELVLGPWPGAAGRESADGLHRRRRDRRAVLAPLVTDVRQHTRDLFVGQRRANRWHQSDRSLLSVQQNADRYLGRRKRPLGVDERRRKSVLPAPVGLMT